jgi:hypothetical protein
MSDATVKLGWDNSAARAGAAEAVSIAQQVAVKSEKALSKVGMSKGGGLQKGAAGQIAMQAQDIAVQAQMGTNALQIFAQQGSQIASLFGPGGAIVGGVAAIAGALVFAGQKGNEAFAELIASSQTFAGELSKVISSGSISQMADLLGEVEKKQAAIAEESKALTSSLGSFAKGVLGTFTGGPSMAERREQLTNAEVALEQTRATLIRESLGMARDELEVKLARLRGDEVGAAALERQLGLEREILRIRQSALPTAAQDELIANAKLLAEEEEKAANAAVRAAEAKARGDARGGMNAARKAVETFGESEEEKLIRLTGEKEKLQAAVVAARGDEVKQMEAATALAEMELEILRTKAGLEKVAADEKARQAKEAEAAFDAEARRQEAERERQANEAQAAAAMAAAQRTARADAEAELEILRMKASGQLDAAAVAEEELKIKQDARAIAEALNISYKAALEMAREKAGLEKKVNEEANKKASEGTEKNDARSKGRIQGFSAEKMGGRDEARERAAQRRADSDNKRSDVYKRSFQGLQGFYNDPSRDWDLDFRLGLGDLPGFPSPKQEPLISTSKAEAAAAKAGKSDPAVAILENVKALMERTASGIEMIAVA